MEVIELFEEVGCEEFYGYDYAEELEEILVEAANFQLQEIADSEATAAVDLQWEELIGNQFLCSEFESSHVEA